MIGIRNNFACAYGKNLKDVNSGDVKLLGFIVDRNWDGNVSKILGEQYNQAGGPIEVI